MKHACDSCEQLAKHIIVNEKIVEEMFSCGDSVCTDRVVGWLNEYVLDGDRVEIWKLA